MQAHGYADEIDCKLLGTVSQLWDAGRAQAVYHRALHPLPSLSFRYRGLFPPALICIHNAFPIARQAKPYVGFRD